MKNYKKINTSVQYWTPKEGEVLEGRYTGAGSILTKNGEMEYFTLVQEDNTTIRVVISAGLKNSVESFRHGCDIKLIYLGLKVNERNAREYHAFDVYMVDEEKNFSDG